MIIDFYSKRKPVRQAELSSQKSIFNRSISTFHTETTTQPTSQSDVSGYELLKVKLWKEVV